MRRYLLPICTCGQTQSYDAGMMRKVFGVTVALALLLNVGIAAIRFYPPARLAAVVAIRHNHGCPLAQALHSQEDEDQQTAITERFQKAFRLIANDPEGISLWDTPRGRYWIRTGGEHVLAHNLAEQERRIYLAGSVRLKPGDTVLDCGPNVGVFTKVALAAGAKTVVAIEPSPDNVSCLRRTFSDEISKGRVIVVPKGVWDKDDVLELRVDRKNSARDSFVIKWEEANETVRVPLTTIDKLVSELALNRVDFIKMDIEGAEKQALEGARKTLETYRPQLAIATEHFLDDGATIPAVVQGITPQYQVECGPCVDLGAAIRPDVIYFR